MLWLENPGVENVESKYFFNQLDIDQAFLSVSSEFKGGETTKQHEKLWIYSLSSNCHQCPYQREGEISNFIQNSERILKISTRYPLKFRLRTSGQAFLVPHDTIDDEAFCDVGPVQLGEFGVYQIKAISPSAQFQPQDNLSQMKVGSNCEFIEIHPPVNIFYPLLLAVISFSIFLFLGLRIFKCLTRSKLVKNSAPSTDKIGQNNQIKNATPSKSQLTKIEKNEDGVKRRRSPRLNKNLEADFNAQSEETEEKSLEFSSPRKRFDFIDIFRGVCIFLMILANDGGAGYTFMQHANWDGLNLADVIFPWFLWIMGVSISISLQNEKDTSNKRQKLWTIFRRSCKMVALGILINLSSMLIRTSTVDLNKLRLPGVLQRFGICYLIASTLFIFGSRRTHIGWIFILFLLFIHTCLTFFLPVPNCPMGYLGPGGLHENGKYSPVCIGGAAGFIDRLILSENHMSRFPTAHSVYNPTPSTSQGQGQPFDPEGILATLTSLLQAWLGVQAGASFLSSRLKKNSSKNLHTFRSMSTFSVGAIGLGLFLHQSSLIPINKNLWSLSFVLVTSGFAWFLLLLLYYVTEVKRGQWIFWDGSPFREMGLNAVLLYVGHSVCGQLNCLPFHWSIQTLRMSTHTIRLVETLWGLSLWILVALVCHYKKCYWVIR